MTDQPEGRNLPAIVKLVGGAAVEVLQWPDHANLSVDQITKMMIIVENDPTLNTPHVVDMLADAAAHHGEDLDSWFESVVRQHGMTSVHDCLEVMWEIGARSATRMTGSAEELLERNGELMAGLQFLGYLREQQIDTSDLQVISDLVDRLGGWESARDLSREDISEFLFSEATASEFDEEAGDIGMSETDAPKGWTSTSHGPDVASRTVISSWLGPVIEHLGRVTGLGFEALVERAGLRLHPKANDLVDPESLAEKHLAALQHMRRHEVLKLVDVKLTPEQAEAFNLRPASKKD